MPSPKTKKILQHIEDQIILSFFGYLHGITLVYISTLSKYTNDIPVYMYVVEKFLPYSQLSDKYDTLL